MLILSIDVGMKHLACCLFSVTNNEYIINKWCVINLCDDVIFKCMGISGSKKCTKNAKFQKNNTYYCKTHAKKCSYLVPTQNDNIDVIKKKKLLQIKEIFNNYELTHDSTVKMKKNDYILKIINHLKEYYFDNITYKLTKNISMTNFGISIQKNMNAEFKDFNIELVLIENQIGPLAMRMKTLQGMIMQHFIENNIMNVKEISAHNKLKLFVDKKTTYNERKKLSIDFTKKILNINNINSNWLEYFNSHKKKDDLADCFLQGLWFFKENNLENININNI